MELQRWACHAVAKLLKKTGLRCYSNDFGVKQLSYRREYKVVEFKCSATCSLVMSLCSRDFLIMLLFILNNGTVLQLV